MIFSNRTASDHARLLDEIFDSLDAAIWSFDKTSNELTVSVGVEKLLGYTRTDFTRNPFLWRDVTHPDDTGILQAFFQTLDSGKSGSLEHRIISPAGDIKWVQCIASPVLNEDTEVIRINGVIHDITEQKTTREAMDKQRLMVREMLNTVDVAVWSFDLVHKRFDYITEAVTTITGYPVDFFLDVSAWKTIIHPEDANKFASWADQLRQGTAAATEFRIIDSGEQIRWILVRVMPMDNAFGEITRYDGLIVDITSRKTMEDALHRSEQRYKSLFDHHSDMIVEVDLNGTVVAMNDSAESVFADQNLSKGKRVWSDMLGPQGQAWAKRYFELAKTGQSPQYTINTHHVNELVRQWAVTHVPIYVNGAITGVFAIGSDMTAKNKIERDLAETQSQYRLIAENTKDLLAIIDVTGTFVYNSPSFGKVLGHHYRSLTGASGFDYIHEDDRQIAFQAMSEVVESGASRQLRLRYLHADGHTVYIDMVGTAVTDEKGQVESLVLVGRDITEEVRFEKKLVKSEERYRRLIELSPQPIICHKNDVITYMNPAGLALMGFQQMSELVGAPVLKIVHPDYLHTALKRIALARQTKYVVSLEYRLIRRDGQWIDVESTGIYDDETQTNLVFLYDVTDRKKMGKALRESEERYRRMVELSPLSIAIYEESGISYLNPAGLKLIGAQNPEQYMGKNPVDFVHPMDREFVARRMEQTLREGYCPSAEYRILGIDGRVVDVSVTSIHDPITSSVQLVLRDISARKQAQSALLESEEMNRRLVELSPEAIILHSDFEYIFANPAAAELLGVTKDIAERSILNRIDPADRNNAIERISKVYSESYTSPFIEQKIVRFDGYIVDVEVISAPISYKGKNAGLTLIRDITERKKAEERRKHAEQTLLESQDRYYRLQMSLDRFSSDLFGVMKIQELERRLVKEVRDVLKATKVSLIEVEHNDRIFVKAGNHVPDSVPSSLFEWNDRHPVCEIIDTAEGYILKLGEIRGKIYLLCIGDKPPLLTLQPKRMWLETICRYVSVLYDNFRVIEDLTNELEQITNYQSAPSWLLRILFKISEHERKRLSQDLHDAALQEQIIWYRKLDQILSDPALPILFREPMTQIMEGLLNVIYQIRITCNELRPPLLKQEGLVSSLETLFEFTQIRANYAIRFDASEFHTLLSDDQVIGLYRIAQEMLANATKHSNATEVKILLMTRPDRIELHYEDNGIGMDVTHSEGSFKSMGVYGMKERVRSLGGNIELHSSPNKGLKIFIHLPVSSENRLMV